MGSKAEAGSELRYVKQQVSFKVVTIIMIIIT